MKYVTFGEIMLRLTVPDNTRILNTDLFTVSYAGAEANVAVALALYGCDASFVTKLPEGQLGQAARNQVRRYGVDTSDIVTGGRRLGIYFYEKGVCHRPASVIYDRENSAIAAADPSEFNWNRIFDGAGWYHCTGITPALSENAAKMTLDSVIAAKKLGLTVSCDLNYRSRLWSKEDARRVMTKVSRYTDVMITNMDQAFDVLGIKPGDGPEPESDEAYLDLSRRIVSEYGCSHVAYTTRQSLSASHNIISGILYEKSTDRLVRARKYDLTEIADRVGGGDSFGAGLIYTLSRGCAAEYCVNFAVAAECLKHTIDGDFNLTTEEETLRIMSGDGSAKIQR